MKQLTQNDFAKVKKLSMQGLSYSEIARQLTNSGYRTIRGNNITQLLVNKLALENGLRKNPSKKTRIAANEGAPENVAGGNMELANDKLSTLPEILNSNLSYTLKCTIVKEIAKSL